MLLCCCTVAVGVFLLVISAIKRFINLYKESGNPVANLIVTWIRLLFVELVAVEIP